MNKHPRNNKIAVFVCGFFSCAVLLLLIVGLGDWETQYTAHVIWYLRLHGFKYIYGNTYSDGTIELDAGHQPVSDISCLSGLPIRKLSLDCTDVEDISPLWLTDTLTSLDLSESKVKSLVALQGLDITELHISKTDVSDLSPLCGSPLAIFRCNESRVTNIVPVINPRLRDLSIMGCAVDDLSPLTNAASLIHISVSVERFPKNGEQVRILRGLKNLSSINAYNTEYFWKRYDERSAAQ